MFDLFNTSIGQIHAFSLEFLDVIPVGFLIINALFTAGLEIANDAREQAVVVAGLVGGARDDEWSARLVDQNIVYFVNNAEVVFALDHFFDGTDHVIAEVIEAKFVVGTIGNIGIVS